MGVTLDQLVYDATDGGAEVGSHVLAGTDGTAIGHTGDALHVDIQNTSIAVSATDLDIRDLSASQDNVAISDGTDTLAINTDGSINIKQAAPSNPQRELTAVGTSAVELVATPLTDRTRILVQNQGQKDVWIGEDNTVTSSGANVGIKIPRGASMELPYGAAANIFAISTAAGQDVVVYELD